MNKFVALFALLTGFAVLAPASAEAGDRHSSSRCVSHHCRSCGTPVYKVRVVIGCDRHGCHIYGWRAVPHRCAPSYHGHGHGHGRDHDRHGSDHGRGHGHRRGR